MKACFFIGLGGTGYEILDFYTEIKKDFESKEEVWEEYFCLDVTSYQKNTEKPQWKRVVDPENAANNFERYHQLVGFNEGRVFVKGYKESLKVDTNIEKIFPPSDTIIDNKGNNEGCWYIRKLGFLSLFSHLEEGDTIFRNIEIKISDYMNNIPKKDRLNVFIFIINSLAGGTGSGLCFPFTALLRQRLKSTFARQEVYFHFNLISVLPEVLKKGERSATPEKQMHYSANTYIALKEIEYFLKYNKEASWDVQFDNKNSFSLEKNEVLFNKVFILGDRNTESKTLHAKDYKPYFQMVGWFLFVIARQSETFLQAFGDERDFGSFGLAASEIPISALLKYQNKVLLGEIGNDFREFREENSKKVQDHASDFGLETEFLKFEKKLLKEVQKNELNIQNEVERCDSVEKIKEVVIPRKSIEGDFKLFEESFIKNFDDFIKDKIEKGWSLRDLAGLVFKTNDLNDVLKQGNQKKRDEKEYSLTRTKGDLANSSKKKSARKHKMDVEKYDSQREIYERILGLQARIDEYLELRSIFFKDLNSLFTRKFPSLWTTKNNPIEVRFPAPPSDLCWDQKRFPELKDLALDLERELYAKYKGKDRKEAFEEVVKELMIEFAKETRDEILNLYEKQFQQKYGLGVQVRDFTLITADFEAKFVNLVRDFLKKNLFMGMDSFILNYPESYSDTIVKRAQPYIQTKHKIGVQIQNYVFANKKVCDGIGPDFAEYAKEKFLLPDNLIVFFSLSGNLSLQDIEPHLKSYKKDFESLEPEERRHCFLDSRLPIYKEHMSKASPDQTHKENLEQEE